MSEPVPADIERALGASAGLRNGFGDRLYYLSEIGSTNDEAARLAQRGADEGTLVLASSQTAGRGRLGRQWFSPADAGLYASVICRDRRAAPLLTIAGGVAVAEGIRDATGLPVEIKWPNDVVLVTGLPPTRRKIAGILAEASSFTDGLQYVVLGFGVNLRPSAYPLDIAVKATSIETELGRPVERGLLLAAILSAFGSAFGSLRGGDSESVLARWRVLAPSASGAHVRYEAAGATREGITAGMADDGALLVRSGSDVQRVLAGEIVWL
jgi:BirA family transcriptional regulator, biotin operon repressor / biotin---[acetyl-CoA-carboxylase] ligase